ncbi:hypothetical protein EDB89DRAFT_845017 [Lactarius sanguifluus]|nr:hypothetical protein EDB89DRAFT_845017 [Lactarius sanguifluus]
MDDEQWLRPFRAFGGVKDFRLADELATDVLHALRLADEGHDIVLPALQNLHVTGPLSIDGPLRDSVESFFTQRQLYGHPVQIYYGSPQQRRQFQPSSFLNLKPPPTTASSVEILTKLKQVEMRMADLRDKQIEATQAGRTDEADKLGVILSRHIAACKKGREFVMRMLEAKKATAAAAAAAQGQGPSSQPTCDPTPTAGTTQHSTPRMTATPQPTPNANSHPTLRLATPRMAANPDPMPSHATAKSGVGVGPGSATSANANAALRAFNPAAAQIPTQTGLAGLSGPEAHGLGAMLQHGLSHSNPLGQQQQHQSMPPNTAAQMKKLVERRVLAQNATTHIPAGNGARTNGGTGAPIAPTMVGGFGESRGVQWVGTFVWQGTDPTRNEKKEVRAQIVATAPSGNPHASTWPKVLSLAPAGPAVPMNEFQEWIKKTQPVLMKVQAAPGADGHNFGQLVKLLRERSYYALAGWEIQGKGRTTMNLLIAPFSQGLICAAFPVSGMPELPKPRVPQLDPAVRQTIFNLLPPHFRNMPEPQLSQMITQIYIHRYQASQGAAALSQQQQAQQQQQQTQPDCFPQNPGTSNGPMFGNLGLKQGELNPFVPGSQVNAIASGLLMQPATSLEH